MTKNACPAIRAKYKVPEASLLAFVHQIWLDMRVACKHVPLHVSGLAVLLASHFMALPNCLLSCLLFVK